MTLPLALTVPLMADEPTTYFAARLAARNFLNARSFAADMAFRFEDLERGCAKTISHLSEISGADPSRLVANSPQALGGKLYLGGQVINPKFRRATRLVVCPACLKEDIECANVAPSIAVRGRIQWTLTSIRTCVEHGIALVTMANEMNQEVRHDWTYLISPMLPDLPALTDRAVRRPPSKLETYLVNRLRGINSECWLNGLSFFAAEQTAQLFGSAILYGNTAIRDLSDDHKYAAGDVGFEVVKDGPSGISNFLSKIDAGFIRKGAIASPQSVYGRIYYRLHALSNEPAFREVHDIVADHIMSRFPLGPGDEIFNNPVTTRRFHSALTLSKKHACSERRIEDILNSEGFSLESRGSGQKALFEATKAELAVERALQAVTLVEAQKRLGVAESIMNILLANGFVQRRRVGRNFLGLRFRSDELDAFLKSVMEGAEPVERSTSDMKSLSYASAHARCKIATIIQMIIDKKLPWVGRRVRSVGLASLLVYPEDVKTALGRSPLEGLSALEAGRRFSIAGSTFRQLAARKIIEAREVRHPLSGRVRLRFSESELDRFNSEYVSLYNLSKELGQRRDLVRRELKARGVMPVPETDGLNAIFYRRAEVGPLP